MRDRRGKSPKTVVANGDRNVAVGRDATGAVVVTGDNNQVFAGNQIRLIEAVIDPASVYERVGLDRFVGREWLDAQVDGMLAEQDRGLFLLEAGAGLGKTAYLAHLARSRDWIQHFVETARGAGGVARGLQSLAAQLIQRYDIPPYARDGVLPASGGSPESLASLLTQAAALRDARGSHEPIVLVVDALDESAAPEGHNVMGLPRVLPRGVYLVCSQRPVAVTLAVEGPPQRVVRLVAGERDNLTDMQEFLRRAAARPAIAAALAAAQRRPAEFVDTLLDRCHGVWIYLQYVIAGIELGHYKPLDLEALPHGVWQFYAAFWMRWHAAATWKPLVRPLLGVLAAAQEDASVERLCEFGDIPDRDAARDLMDGPWRPFLTTVDRPGTDRQYRLYHASLREFLDGRVDRDDLTTAQLDVADELAAATREAHARTATRYLTAWGGLDAGLPRLQEPAARDVDGGYGLRYLIEHLVAAGNVIDAKRVLSGEWVSEQPRVFTRFGWRGLLDRVLRRKRVVVDRFPKNAWFVAKGGTADLAGYLTDQQRAWRGAETESARAIAAGEPARSIALEVRCALAIASLNDIAGNVGPQLLEALVREEVIAATTAFAYAIQTPEPAQRMHALIRVAPRLDEPRRSEAYRSALAALLQVPRPEVDAALEALPSGIADDILREIVSAIRSQGNDRSFISRRLARLVPALSEPVLEEVVTFATGLQDEGVALLAAACARSQPPARNALVARLMQQVQLTEYSSPAEVIAPLLGIAADLTPEFRARVIDEARRRLTDAYGFNHVAGPLLRVLDAKTRPEVAALILRQALDRGDVREAIEVCGPLLALLPEPALGSLDSLARTSGDEGARHNLEAFAARSFAETGDGERALQMVDLLAPGSGTHDPRPYAESIMGVAPLLPASDIPELLRRARTISDPEGRRRALDALTPRLGPAELEAAFEATTRIDDRYYAELAQVDARAAAAPGGRADPLEWAFDSGWLPGRRLAAVARWLPADAFPRAVSRARAIPSAESRAEALAGLAAAGAPDAAGLTDEMVAAAAEAATAGRINILAEALSSARLRSILIGNRRTEALRRLLATVRETETLSSLGYRTAEVIAQIADGLDEPSIRSVLDAASRIASQWPAGKAFQALAPRLPERALRVLAVRESSLGARATAVPPGGGLWSLARLLPPEIAAQSGRVDATELARRLEKLATTKTSPIEEAAMVLHEMHRAPQNERLANLAAFAILRTDDLDNRLRLLFAFTEAAFHPNQVETWHRRDRFAWNILMAALALPEAPRRALALEELAGYVDPFARAALGRAVAALRALPPERVPPAESVDAVLIDVARLIRADDAGERAQQVPPDVHSEIPTLSAVVEACAERGGNRGIAALAELVDRLPRANAESAVAEYTGVVSRGRGHELAGLGRSLNALLPSPPDTIVATVTAAMFSPDARERLDPQTAVALAERMPMEMLMVAWRFAATRIGYADRTQVLGIICRRLSDATPVEAYRHWREMLRFSAAGHRVSLLRDLGALSPLIAKLGTSAAVDGTIDAIVNAENWWP